MNKNESKGLSPSQFKIVRLSGNHRVIATHPYLNKVYGIAKGTFFYQMLYWEGKQQDKLNGWIRKKKDETYDETGLTINQQDSAVNKGIELGFLEQINKGIPCTRHLRIHVNLFLETTERLAKSKGLVTANYLVQFPEKRITTSESTQDTSTEKAKVKKSYTGMSSVGDLIKTYHPSKPTKKGL